MAYYLVEVPVTLTMTVGVYANNEEEAKAKVVNSDLAIKTVYDDDLFPELDFEWNYEDDDIEVSTFDVSVDNLEVFYLYIKNHFQHKLDRIAKNHRDNSIMIVKQVVKNAMIQYVKDCCVAGTKLSDIINNKDLSILCEGINDEIIFSV